MGYRFLVGLLAAAAVPACGGSSQGTADEAGGARGGTGVMGGEGGSAMPAGAGGFAGSGSGSGGAGMHRGTRYGPNPPVCTTSDSAEDYPEQVLGTTVGLTETATDYCDDDGNLVQHRCEILPSTDCAPCVPGCPHCEGECPPCSEHTGRVLEVPFDCGSDCRDGVCLSWCPTQGHELRIELGLDSTLRVENRTVPGVYDCTPLDDGSAEGICLNLDGYVGDRVYEYTGTCYGEAPTSLRLSWTLDGQGPYGCFVECTRTAPPTPE